MRRELSVALLWWCACGTPGEHTLVENGPRSPRFVLQGDCAPSTRSTLLTLDARASQCASSFTAPTLINDETNCRDDVDFSQQRAVVVPARGAREWFVFANFVAERSDAIELGLVIRPQGALPPDTLVVLPRDDRPVELRWCRSVCVQNCDVPLP